MGQTPYESVACETKGIMDSTAQSKIFTISKELLHVGSYEDDQLKVLKLFCVFLGSNVNLECHIKFINLGVLSVSTMANSLIAVVSYCMHCKVCMPLNHGICTSSTDYFYCLLVYDMLQSHSMCHFHTQPVSYCKTYMQDHVTQLHQSCINAQISLVPMQAPTQLSVGSASDQKRLPLNL